MDNDFFDKVLDDIISEAVPLYLEEENKKYENIEEVKFSEIHNQKMKKIFKDLKRKENKKRFIKCTKKVAIVIASAILVTGLLFTTVEAWRREVVKYIMENKSDNYMEIRFANPENE